MAGSCAIHFTITAEAKNVIQTWPLAKPGSDCISSFPATLSLTFCPVVGYGGESNPGFVDAFLTLGYHYSVYNYIVHIVDSG